ncbi:thiamine pyrophosphate-dependent dehydrogenase E1 component subunit alpha [Natronorubrum sp. FCH18a]|uniref:thiamine pyrophosphate-dependent dehydrogenase E1 component subunit alpha n=1 Tax=Natronorubrum sp. FCH18a TaxID=3447018 RepID=UPI003F5198CE
MAQWTEQRPSEEFDRILHPDGHLVGELPDIDAETILRLYRTMLESRIFDEKTLAMQRRGEVSIVARSTSEEAVPAGSSAALEEGDWCFPTYRQTPASLYWNARKDRAVAALMGAEPEVIDEHLPVEEEPPVNFTPVYVPLAVNVTNAVGSAMADEFRGDDHVSMSYIGDGSTSQGDFHEALNFAGVFDAPAVTICQNNQWAISVPSHRQTAAETFAQKAEAHGVPYERVDGNDVLAVYEASTKAVERARRGDGPTFIEAVTYRMIEHNTADEESVYRTTDEREYWEDKDPIDRLETYLLSEGLLGDDDPEKIREDLREEVQEAVDRAREVPVSDPETMFEHHLHESTWKHDHQREELRAEQRGENPFTDFTGEGLE